MSWGSSGGGGVGTGVGSPEAERGRRALDDRHDGPPDADPPPRPGCRRGALAVVGLLVALVAGLWILGEIAARLS